MEDFNIETKYSGLFQALHDAYLNSKEGEDFSSAINKIAEEENIQASLELYDKICNQENVLSSQNKERFDEFFNDSILNHVLKNETTPLEYIRLAMINLRDASNQNVVFEALNDIVSDRFHEESGQLQNDINKFLSSKKEFYSSVKTMNNCVIDSNGYKIAKRKAEKHFEEILKMGYYPTKEEQESFKFIWKAMTFYNASKAKKVLIIAVGAIVGIALFIGLAVFVSAIFMIVPFVIACYIAAPIAKKHNRR